VKLGVLLQLKHLITLKLRFKIYKASQTRIPSGIWLRLYGWIVTTWLLSIWVPSDVFFCHGQKRDYIRHASQRREARLKSNTPIRLLHTFQLVVILCRQKFMQLFAICIIIYIPIFNLSINHFCSR